LKRWPWQRFAAALMVAAALAGLAAVGWLAARASAGLLLQRGL
jgi:hypothetical protein